MKLKVNPKKQVLDMYVSDKLQERAEQISTLPSIPSWLRPFLVTQWLIRLPFAIVFTHGDLVIGGWRFWVKAQRVLRIIYGPQSEFSEERWEKCKLCPARIGIEDRSYCSGCGCGAPMVEKLTHRYFWFRWRIFKPIREWLKRVGSLENQNELELWKCPVGFF